MYFSERKGHSLGIRHLTLTFLFFCGSPISILNVCYLHLSQAKAFPAGSGYGAHRTP